MVCGSIGHGGLEDIKSLYSLLRKEGFDTLDHISAPGMDYSKVRDFRGERKLSGKIIKYDLERVRQTDVLVVLAGAPSYGAGIEVFVAKNAGKKVVLLARGPISSPWPVGLCDFIVSNEKELIRLLRGMRHK